MTFNLANVAILTIYTAYDVSTDYEQPINFDFECSKLTHITLEPVGVGPIKYSGFVKLSSVLIVFVQANCRLLLRCYTYTFFHCAFQSVLLSLRGVSVVFKECDFLPNISIASHHLTSQTQAASLHCPYTAR